MAIRPLSRAVFTAIRVDPRLGLHPRRSAARPTFASIRGSAWHRGRFCVIRVGRSCPLASTAAIPAWRRPCRTRVDAPV